MTGANVGSRPALLLVGWLAFPVVGFAQSESLPDAPTVPNAATAAEAPSVPAAAGVTVRIWQVRRAFRAPQP